MSVRRRRSRRALFGLVFVVTLAIAVGALLLIFHRHRPGGPAGVQSTQPAPKPAAAVLRWQAVRGARYYLVELSVGGRRVFETWSSAPRADIPFHWIYSGRRYTFRSGRYSWTVRASRPTAGGARLSKPFAHGVVRARPRTP
jgi:hypothetical protein